MTSSGKYTTWGSNEVDWRGELRLMTMIKVKGEENVFYAVLDKSGQAAIDAAAEFEDRRIVETEY